jgi:hypothetical protein
VQEAIAAVIANYGSEFGFSQVLQEFAALLPHFQWHTLTYEKGEIYFM